MSVVMPAYNCERYVVESVASILHQTLLDLELIVIDDCSTDGTGDLLEGLHDPRVRLLRARSHRGQTACINLGLSAARGEYVARQDADDISTLERLETQVSFLESHSETMMVGSSGWLVDADGGAPRSMRVRANPLAIKWGLLFGTALTNLMWRRDYVARHIGKYAPEMRYAEDFEFVARVASVTLVANLPARLMLYRRHPQAVGVAHRASEDAAAEQVCLRQFLDLMGTAPPVPIAWLRAVALSAPDSVPAHELPRVLAVFGTVHDRFAALAAELPSAKRMDLLAVRREAGASVGLALASAYRRGVGQEALAAALGWRTSAALDVVEEASHVCLRRLKQMASPRPSPWSAD